MISKIKKNSFILVLMLTLGLFNLNVRSFATIGESGVVVKEDEDIETTLLNGIKLHEQDLGFYEDGDMNKYNVWSTQYLEMPIGDVNTKIVSWSYRESDAWRKMGVSEIAKNFEENNPGWIVVGGTNNDFFATNSTNSSGEMDYNAMENGELIKARNNIAYSLWRGILGFDDNNNLVEGAPTVTSYYNIHIYNDNTMSTEIGTLQSSCINPEQTNSSGVRVAAPVSETGITVLTKDVIGVYDLTGYEVVVGKYDITRIGYSDGSMLTSNGFNIYVKGEIIEKRNGVATEQPEDYRTIDDRTDGVKEFYLVSKDGSLDSLEIGDYVKIQKDYTGIFENVNNAVSYYWKILEDGTELFKGIGDATTRSELSKQYASGDFSYITAHKARCLFGVKADGTYVMAVIDGTSSTGTTLSEAATYMKELGCVDAWNFDGGGSATLIARGENGSFETINTPSDSGGASERLVGNAILMVVRDPGFESSLRYSTATTVTLTKKNTSNIFSKMENIKINIDGRTIEVENNQETVIIDDLLPGEKYYATISYTYDGVDYSATMPVETKEYKSGIGFTPTSDGFIIKVDSTDSVLKTISVTLKVDNETYTMNEINEFTIKGLLLNTIYDIEYSYVVKNINTNRTYTVDAQTIKLTTLSYQIPIIDYFEEYSFKNNTLKIKYSYKDSEGLLTDAYILVNGVRDNSLDVSSKSGLLTLKDLELSLFKYTYQLVLEYDTPAYIPKKIYSEILVYGDASECSHEFDNDCDTTCNLCVYTRIVEHNYSDATCTAPTTCIVCGVTQGLALGHNYSDAICTAPATCIVCGATQGSALGHNYSDATKDAPATCTVCGATTGEKLKGCSGCKKSTIAQMILGALMLASTLLIFRKRK